MRITIHPEIHRALYAAREEEIARAVARHRDMRAGRRTWAVRLGRALARDA